MIVVGLGGLEERDGVSASMVRSPTLAPAK